MSATDATRVVRESWDAGLVAVDGVAQEGYVAVIVFERGLDPAVARLTLGEVDELIAALTAARAEAAVASC